MTLAPDLKNRLFAATLHGMLALLVGGIWVIYLFAYNPPAVSALDNLSYAFLSGTHEQRRIFLWTAVFLVSSTLLCAAYLTPLARTKRGAMTLLVASTAQGIAAVSVLALRPAYFFLAPLYWCYLCYKQI